MSLHAGVFAQWRSYRTFSHSSESSSASIPRSLAEPRYPEELSPSGDVRACVRRFGIGAPTCRASPFPAAPSSQAPFGGLRMASRLSAALRELTAALEECGEDPPWVVVPNQFAGSVADQGPVEPKRRPRAAAGSSASSTSAAPSVGSGTAPARASDIVYKQDIRFYIVLCNPQDREAEGLYSGPAAVAWPTVERTLKGQRLAGSGARLKRVQDYQEGLKTWEAARPLRTSWRIQTLWRELAAGARVRSPVALQPCSQGCSQG